MQLRPSADSVPAIQVQTIVEVLEMEHVLFVPQPPLLTVQEDVGVVVLFINCAVGTITTVLPTTDDDGNGVGVGAELNCAYADVPLASHSICVAKNSDAPDLLMPDKKTDTSRK